MARLVRRSCAGKQILRAVAEREAQVERLAGVDRTAHGSVPPRCGFRFFHLASVTRMHAPVW
jgi:hypothetical protein